MGTLSFSGLPKFLLGNGAFSFLATVPAFASYKLRYYTMQYI